MKERKEGLTQKIGQRTLDKQIQEEKWKQEIGVGKYNSKDTIQRFQINYHKNNNVDCEYLCLLVMDCFDFSQYIPMLSQNVGNGTILIVFQGARYWTREQ
jgi:hypothetical protein